jgi:hypothetical protein
MPGCSDALISSFLDLQQGHKRACANVSSATGITRITDLKA